jgi:hypothetical protein
MRWRVGGGFGYFWSDLVFDGDRDAAIERRALTASIAYRPTDRWSIELGGGASVSGSLTLESVRQRIEPGWMASGAASFQVLRGEGSAPFLLASLSFAGSGARTSPEPERLDVSAESLYAIDARVGLTLGKTFWNVLSPYVAIRAFGGPVLWRFRGQDITGTDRYHVQAAVGLLALVARRVDVFAELAPLGERAVAIGAGAAF